MKLLINGQELENALSLNTPLGDALRTVQAEQIPHDQVISQILIDGQPLSAEQLAQWKDRPVKDFSETRIEALDKTTLAIDSLRLLAENLGKGNDLRCEISDMVCKAKTTDAMNALQTYVELWLGIHQSLESICRLLDIDLDTTELFNITRDQPTPAQDVIKKLTDQLAEIKAALEAGDFILLGDILDYEFGDITNEWKALLTELADRAE